jgi:hypothetical protein
LTTTPTIEIELLSDLDLDQTVPCEAIVVVPGGGEFTCGEPATYRIKTVCINGHPRVGFVCEGCFHVFAGGRGKCLRCDTPLDLAGLL